MYVPAPPAQAAPVRWHPLPVSCAPTSASRRAAHLALCSTSEQLDVLTGRTQALRQAGVTQRAPASPSNCRRAAGSGWRTIAATRTRGGGPLHPASRRERLGSEAIRVSSPATGPRSPPPAGGDAERVSPGGGILVRRRRHDGMRRRAHEHTLGVANKTLPCGTLVTLRYGSRTSACPSWTAGHTSRAANSTSRKPPSRPSGSPAWARCGALS